MTAFGRVEHCAAPGKDEATARLPWSSSLFTVALAALAVVAVFWETLASAVSVWANSETYNFAFLVVPVSLYLIWQKRHALARHHAKPVLPALLLLLPLALLWLVSDAAEVALGRQLAFVGTLQVLFLAMLGRRLYGVLLFPFAYLWLMVPAADFLVPSLQALAAELTVASLNLLGVPSSHEGILITAAGVTYGIVEQCAALDFILGALAFSLVYAYLFFRRPLRRVAFIAIAVATALFANIVRTTSIIFLSHATDGRIDLVADHRLYGWSIFLVTLLLLMGLGFLFREEEEPAPLPVETDGQPDQRHLLATGLLAVLIASLAPIYASAATDRSLPPEEIALCAPTPQGSWQPLPGEADWQGFAPSADRRLSRRYARMGEAASAQIFIAYYWRQRPGAELIGWENRIADNDDWLLLVSEQRKAEIEGQTLPVSEALLRAKHERRLVWHWYWVDGRFTGSRLTAKLLQAKAALLGGERRSAFVAVWTEESGDAGAARRLLRSFAAEGLFFSEALKAAGRQAC